MNRRLELLVDYVALVKRVHFVYCVIRSDILLAVNKVIFFHSVFLQQCDRASVGNHQIVLIIYGLHSQRF